MNRVVLVLHGRPASCSLLYVVVAVLRQLCWVLGLVCHPMMVATPMELDLGVLCSSWQCIVLRMLLVAVVATVGDIHVHASTATIDVV